MSKHVIVIGAGVAGLNASIELLQKGQKVTLIEKNSNVGGLCTGYDVDGFYVDACIHWLMGSKKTNILYEMWKNMGAFSDDIPTIKLDSFVTIDYQGTKVRFGRDLEKTRKEWLKISPIDKRAINRFFNITGIVGKVMNFVLKTESKKNPMDIVKTLVKSPAILKSMSLSRDEYSKKFKHPALRFAVANSMTGYNNAFFMFDIYGLFVNDNADFPSGGAKLMMERIKNRFLSLGGNLLLNESIIELKIENKRVFEVKTDKNREISCDYVVSTINPNYLLKNMTNKEYVISKLDKMDKHIDKYPVSSCFNVYVTVEGDISFIDVPTTIDIEPIQVGASRPNYLLIRPYYFDKEYFVKDNKTVVSLFVNQNQNDYYHYKSLSKESLKREEQQIIDQMIYAFISRYPTLKGKVKYLTHFGPIELEERTNTPYGALQSYSLTTPTSFYMSEGRAKGIDNLFICGQWTRSAGGTPTALLTSHAVVKKIK